MQFILIRQLGKNKMAKSRLVSVDFAPTSNYTGIHYAFRTVVDETKGSQLGHELLAANSPVSGLIFKANSPKPPRATKEFATGVSSSFIDFASYSSASAAGWSITPSKNMGRRSVETRFAYIVYVTINGLKYGWSIRKTLFRKLQSNLASLGVKRATASDNLVFGASFPKPPQVVMKAVSGSEIITNSTFYDPSNESSLSANFKTKAGKTTTSDWAEIAL